jgi:phage protein D
MAKVKRKKTTPTIVSSPNMSKEIPKPESAGEELYRVHLQRKAGAEEDFEIQPRTRTHSVGEELWEVHLKRSHGVEPNDDNAEKQDAQNPAAAVAAAAATKKKESSEPRSIHLRNRDVLINNQ